MSHFDERSGLEYSQTPWGQWGQTIEEVYVEVSVAEGTRAKDIVCTLKPKSIAVSVNNETIIKGNLWGVVLADECVWTLEDRKMLHIVLVKSDRDAGNCWKSLLEGDYEANAYVLDKMEKKLTLERFQNENPGFDFSGAEISGNYTGGGPRFN